MSSSILQDIKRKRKNKNRKSFTFTDSETESSDGLAVENIPSKKVVKKFKRKREKKHEESTSSDSEESSEESDYEFYQMDKQKEFYEPCLFNNLVISLPCSLIAGLKDIFGVVSMETWNSLTEHEKESLIPFLPKDYPMEKLLNQLFSGENFFFGNPLNKLHKKMQAGEYHTYVVPQRERFLDMKHKDHNHELRLYQERMLQKSVSFKKKVMQNFNNLNQLEEQPNSCKEIVLEFASNDQRKIEEKTCPSNVEALKWVDDTDTEGSSDEKPFEQNENRKFENELFALGKLPLFFVFRIFKHLFLSIPGFCSTFDNIIHKLKTKYPIINSQLMRYDLSKFTLLALVFLKRLNSHKMFPLVEEQPSNVWRWIGAPCNSTEEKLQSLEQLFLFSISRSDSKDFQKISSLPKSKKSVITIEPTPADLKNQYHSQEIERYNSPEKPFVFSLGGIRSIVAPLKSCSGNNKPRDHRLLRKTRPPTVTIWSLVRDAASRLPGGVGTRADVELLLLDSQYIEQNIEFDSSIGGALDRLRAEQDPCVQFDPNQKLWVYLHRNRNVEDFDHL